MNKKISTILISLNWAFEQIEANITVLHKQKAVEFIKKLSEDFNVKLVSNKDEVLAAKWLIDNDAACLIKCLVNDAENYPIYLNDECIKSCKDFDKLYEVLITFKP